MLRKRTLGNKKKSTYTVYSNCNGGSVYFNNNLVGIISSGKLIVELSGADSYTVKIEGGVPSTSTSTSESTDSGSDTVMNILLLENYEEEGHFGHQKALWQYRHQHLLQL